MPEKQEARPKVSDPTPLTPEKEALRKLQLRSAIIDAVHAQDGVAGVKAFAAYDEFLDAARAAAPDGLREAALAAVKATGCIRVFWGARKPCDDPIYGGNRDLCAICALRAALAQSATEEAARA